MEAKSVTAEVGPKRRKSNPNRGSKPGEHRGGREPGTPNKVTRQLREIILAALDKAGGETYLAQQAKENPPAFMQLLAKVLPTQLTGRDGGPIETEQKREPLTPEARMEKILEMSAKLGIPLARSQ